MNADRYREAREVAYVDVVALGYRTVRLLPLEELQAAQTGYGAGGWHDTGS